MNLAPMPSTIIPTSEPPPPAPAPLRGPWLVIVRTGWALVTSLTLVMAISAFWKRPAELQTLLAIYNNPLAQLHLPKPFASGYVLTLEAAAVLSFIFTALILFWRKSDDWVIIFVSLALVTFGAASSPVMAIVRSETHTLGALIQAAGFSSFLIFLYTFPEGRFVARWTVWLTVVWTAWQLVSALFVTAPMSLLQLSDESIFITLAFFATGLFVQYRRFAAADPMERQRTIWVQVSFVTLFLGYALSLIAPDPDQSSASVIDLLTDMTFASVQYIGLASAPIAISMSTLRLRLWGIAPISNRILVYFVLTSILLVVYAGAVVMIQRLLIFEIVIDRDSLLAIVLSTLGIAALFLPWRQRVQAFIDRRFYREKVDAQQAITSFSQEIRTIIELPDLLRRLVYRVTELLHITRSAVFLRQSDGVFRLAEVAADAAAIPSADPMHMRNDLQLAISPHQLERLASGVPIPRSQDALFPLLVPLMLPNLGGYTNESALLGILALGPRLSGLHYTRADSALLQSLADQAGTAIYVAQLIADRQAEIERKEAIERRLEEHRNSPMGQAEAMAQRILEHPEQALRELHQLAQTSGRDPEATSLIANLPTALDNLNAEAIAGIAEWFNYLVTSQFVPELLPVGLRTLLSQLELVAANDRRRIDAHVEQILSAHDETFAIKGAAEALIVYRWCHDALEANNISQITDLRTRLLELCRDDAAQPDVDDVLADLRHFLAELLPAIEALQAYERLDELQDRLAYLASTVERLRRVDRMSRIELGGADRLVVQRIAENWLTVSTGAMLDLQARARVVCELLTRRTWQVEVISLTLEVHNVGRGAALNMRIELLPTSDYDVLDATAEMERLSAGEEAQIGMRLRLRSSTSANQFRVRFIIRYTDSHGADQAEHFADAVHMLSDDDEFQFIPNPYVVGAPLQSQSPLFFGREDVIHAICENLASKHRNNLALIGQRRTGKTSLLKQLPARLGDAYVPVYLDGQILGVDPGLDNFFLTLATEIAFALEDRNFAVTLPDPEAFARRPAAVFERQFLADVRAAIGDRHLLIMLDEFEELEAAVRRGNLEPSIFGFLRHMIQHTDNLSFIFCGTHRLEELAADYWSILFNMSLYRRIGLLDRAEAQRLIQEPVADYGMRYDDLALDKIWRLTAGHPYLLQLLCHDLVNQHNKTRRSYVTAADVNSVTDSIVAAGEAHVVYLWNESTYAERLALVVLSRILPLGGSVLPRKIYDYLAERGVNIDHQKLNTALHRLVLRDILAMNSDIDAALGERYRWRLGLLVLWVEQYCSLSRVVDEMNV